MTISVPLKLDAYPDAFAQVTRDAVAAFLSDDIADAGPTTIAPAGGSAPLPSTAPRLLGVCGLPHAGKDVIADYLDGTYAGIRRMAFSDAIIAEVNAWAEPLGRRITLASKSRPTHRTLLQQWGLGRRLEDRRYWIEPLGRRVQETFASGAQMVIVTGARVAITPETAAINTLDIESLQVLGGEMWKVDRPRNPYVADNPVEAGLPYVPESCFDAVVLNDREGDLEHYHREIHRTLLRTDRRRTVDVADLQLIATPEPTA